jgi:hypothetical protein
LRAEGEELAARPMRPGALLRMWVVFFWTYPEVEDPRAVTRPTFEDMFKGGVVGVARLFSPFLFFFFFANNMKKLKTK